MAIVFDSATNGSSTTGTSLTFSHTVTGSKTILFVGGLGSTASDKWTGVTYNGVAMTRQYAVQMGSDRWAYLYYLIAPATGANNVVISSASDFISGNAVSYSGVKQTGFPDASNNNLIASGTPNTNTLTTVGNNAWHVMIGAAASGTPTAGTGSTIRGTANGNMAFFDGNSDIRPPKSDSIGMAGYNSSFNSVTIGVSILPDISTGLVSYWKLDESSGNASDSVGSDTGTNYNTVTYSAGKINNGATFTKATPNYFTATGPGSISAGSLSMWVKGDFSSDTTDYGVYSTSAWSTSGNAFVFIRRRDSESKTSRMGWDTYGNSAEVYATNNITTGVWNYCTWTWDTPSKTVKMYINGVLDSTTVLGTMVAPVFTTVRMGGGILTTRDFNGQLDEIGIWSRALTADEVAQLFNSGRANAYPLTDSPSLYGGVAYYKLDESSGNAVDTISSNTLTNNNTVSYSTGKINNGSDFGAGNTNKSLSASNNLGIDGGAISYSCWIKPTALPTSDADPFATSTFNFVHQGNASTDVFYDLHLSNVSGTQRVYFTRARNSVSAVGAYYNTSVSTSSWTHIAGTYDGTNLQVYVNGVAGTGTTDSGTGTGDVNWFNIGSRRDSAGWYPGMVDEVGVFNRALTSTEVTSLYNSGAGKAYPWTASASVNSGFLMFM